MEKQRTQQAADAFGRGDWAEAERQCRTILASDPGNYEALNLLGVVAAQTGRLEEAAELLSRAVTLCPDRPTAHSNLGSVHHDLARNAEALASYDRALRLNPDLAETLNNRGLALSELGRHSEALQSLERALALRPDYASAHFNLAMCCLRLGDLARGWHEHEWRWKQPQWANVERTLPQPLWLGKEPLAGETIVLHYKQGLGDTLQFVRYAPLVAKMGARVVLVVQPQLKRLLACVEGVSAVHAPGEIVPAFDRHCPLMSLPYAFGTELATIPAAVPYVRADEDAAARWRQRLGSAALSVGLVWAGDARERSPRANRIDRRRSVSLAQLAPLTRASGVRFVSLQKGPPALQARDPPPGMDLVDFTSDLDDFADTAALVAALDLVVSVDTSVAHLAGAMGKPVWILSRFDSCWRWLIDRDDSPWYPTVRLFRQPAFGDWASVIERLSLELRRRSMGV